MSNFFKQISLDIDNFSQEGLVEVSKKGLSNSKPKARLVRFEGQMEESMRMDKLSKNEINVVANSNQAGMFEDGFKGEAEVTPLLKRWADSKQVKLGDRTKIDVDYGWTSKTVKKNGVDVTLSRPNMKKFMFNSIPTESEVKIELDRVIKSTIRGGTIYG